MNVPLNVSVNSKYIHEPTNSIPIRISIDRNLVKQPCDEPIPIPIPIPSNITNNNDFASEMKLQSHSGTNSLNTEEVHEASKHGKLALLLHQRWLIRILNYGKTWEIRGRDTQVRGKIYLAYKNYIYGHTHIIDSFPITKEELQSSIHRHHVEDLSIVDYKTPHIWMLKDSVKYPRPILFNRKPGQVVWCKVDMRELQKKNKGKKQNNKSNKNTKKKSKKKKKQNQNQSYELMDIDNDLPPMIMTEIVEKKINLSKKLTSKQWKALIPSNEYLCCDKKVGGTAVGCDKCDGFWHIYCLKHNYHINETELKRIQQSGQSFVCLDCYRKKIKKQIKKVKTMTK